MAGKEAPRRKANSKGGRKPFVRATRDLYQEVTDSIVAQLEAGAVPWRGKRMWEATGPTAPYNAVSGRSYRGWNLLHLMAASMQMSDNVFDPRFCTFKQAKDKGWNIKKGAKSLPVFFYKQVTLRASGRRPEDEGSKALALVRKMQSTGSVTVSDESRMDAAEGQVAGKKIWILKSFPVFHASQVEGIPELTATEPAWEPNEVASQILDALRSQGMGFVEGGDMAGYSVARDCLLMPHKDAFGSDADYGHVLLHECGHATGHGTRLARPELGKDSESDDYAKEELVAEMTSAMLCAQVGLVSEYSEHAAYLQKWLKVLQSDKKLLMRAAGAAASAADYLIDLVPDLRASLAQQRKQSADLDEEVDLAGLFGDDGDCPDDVAVMNVAAVATETDEGLDFGDMDMESMLDEMGEGFTSIPDPVEPEQEAGEVMPVQSGGDEYATDDPRAAAAIDATDWFEEFVEEAPAAAAPVVTVAASQPVKGGLFKKRPVVSM